MWRIMKGAVLRLIVGILLAGAMYAGGWHQIEVDVSGGAPSELSGFEPIFIEPGSVARFIVTDKALEELGSSGIEYEVTRYNLADYYSAKMSAEEGFGDYYTLSETAAIFDSLRQQYSNLISERIILPNDSLGDTTWDGNHVWAVKISDNVGADEAEPEVLYTGIHHAREPIGANICAEWARWLLDGYGDDPVATYLVDEREIWIVPVVNPDGYLYNELTNPGGGGMHRKNRRPTGGGNPGVDPNRNYPYMWGLDDEGSSPYIGDDTYRGPSPGSEPEIQSVMNLCKSREFVTALNFHSYSNLFLYPYGFKNEKCPDSIAYYRWGETATRESKYSVIAGFELYPTNGGSDDWMYDETEGKNRIFAVTPEVGDDFWEEWKIDEQVEENIPLLISTAKAAGKYPELEWIEWVDEDGDGNISADENVELIVGIRNMSVRDESGNIELNLESADSRLQLLTSTASIPSLQPQGSGNNSSNPLSMTVLTDTSDISLNLIVTAGEEEYIYHLILPLGSYRVLIADDFETVDSTKWDTDWLITTEEAHSGDGSLTDSPWSDSQDKSKWDSTKYVLRTREPLDLSEMSSCFLSFWTIYEMEKGWDWCVLDILSEGEARQTLRRFSGFNDSWHRVRFDLSRFCGIGEIELRLKLQTDYRVHEDGFYLDDLKLEAYEAKTFPGLYELVDTRPVFSVDPGVTKGYVNVKGPQGRRLSLELFDASGRRITETGCTTPFEWDLREVTPGLASGVYFVNLVYDEGKTSTKIVLTD
ncbi:T9SS type A sorting domain-containing protein [candidate division WOR-3 bacterium]|uniref:T9SS type A sorting domain-containing protein n=1 Tax=candidate division WOR-3 bacterium TaxID=2052148 RepID=A0A9D5QE22_UNCW3|nr:T9SS type A sorting domain-containing protein [candidate division WOR-3 bacterium]MBD3365667.1 T9SS type A sorting domain-containing protein [candidate division WOR-3 bacterium]